MQPIYQDYIDAKELVAKLRKKGDTHEMKIVLRKGAYFVLYKESPVREGDIDMT